MKWIDSVLNKITMYRLVLYYLIGLLAAAVVFSFFKVLPYDPLGIVFSALFIIAACWITNELFSRVWRVPANVESLYITALILALLIPPFSLDRAGSYFSLAIWASLWAMASKYIFAVNKKHLFNPAAFAVALTALTLGQSATWWVGTLPMLPFVFIGGFLMVRKILRWDLVLSFFAVAFLAISGFGIAAGQNIGLTAERLLENTPFFFFAFVMLTEPLTTPPTRRLRILYGALVGFLFVPTLHIGSLYSTPELALLAGNVFSYAVSPKRRLVLRLKEKIKLGPGVYEFVFVPDAKMKFTPGQYLEWTLGHEDSDRRGVRRYFTIASSPTEREFRLGVKFYEPGSTFKKALLGMRVGDTVFASQLAGDFTLPKDKKKKLVFIAGGIGITPFRSMVKYLLDKNEARSVVLLYSNNHAEEIAYGDIFDEAGRRVGMKTFYTLTGPAPESWAGERGYVNAAMIARCVPDYRERLFYISGPHAMVAATEAVLKRAGVDASQIKKDFFPGFV